jgi:hypothetical protein
MTDWIVDTTFAPGMVVGMFSPLVALVVVGVLYARHRLAVHQFLYWLAALAAGIVVGFLGMIKGGEMACPKAGNLCGLFGVFRDRPDQLRSRDDGGRHSAVFISK